MITCDLCGEAKDCMAKEIEGKEYDICSECWKPLAERLKGKGRVLKRDIVFLQPPRVSEPEKEEPKPLPGEPPKIWGCGGSELHRQRGTELDDVAFRVAATIPLNGLELDAEAFVTRLKAEAGA